MKLTVLYVNTFKGGILTAADTASVGVMIVRHAYVAAADHDFTHSGIIGIAADHSPRYHGAVGNFYFFQRTRTFHIDSAGMDLGILKNNARSVPTLYAPWLGQTYFAVFDNESAVIAYGNSQVGIVSVHGYDTGILNENFIPFFKGVAADKIIFAVKHREIGVRDRDIADAFIRRRTDTGPGLAGKGLNGIADNGDRSVIEFARSAYSGAVTLCRSVNFAAGDKQGRVFGIFLGFPYICTADACRAAFAVRMDNTAVDQEAFSAADTDGGRKFRFSASGSLDIAAVDGDIRIISADSRSAVDSGGVDVTAVYGYSTIMPQTDTDALRPVVSSRIFCYAGYRRHIAAVDGNVSAFPGADSAIHALGYDGAAVDGNAAAQLVFIGSDPDSAVESTCKVASGGCVDNTPVYGNITALYAFTGIAHIAGPSDAGSACPRLYLDMAAVDDDVSFIPGNAPCPPVSSGMVAFHTDAGGIIAELRDPFGFLFFLFRNSVQIDGIRNTRRQLTHGFGIVSLSIDGKGVAGPQVNAPFCIQLRAVRQYKLHIAVQADTAGDRHIAAYYIPPCRQVIKGVIFDVRLEIARQLGIGKAPLHLTVFVQVRDRGHTDAVLGPPGHQHSDISGHGSTGGIGISVVAHPHKVCRSGIAFGVGQVLGCGRRKRCPLPREHPDRPGIAAKLAFVQVDRYRPQIFGFHLLRYLKNRAIAYARAGGWGGAYKAVGPLAAPIHAHGRITGEGILPPGGQSLPVFDIVPGEACGVNLALDTDGIPFVVPRSAAHLRFVQIAVCSRRGRAHGIAHTAALKRPSENKALFIQLVPAHIPCHIVVCHKQAPAAVDPCRGAAVLSIGIDRSRIGKGNTVQRAAVKIGVGAAGNTGLGEIEIVCGAGFKGKLFVKGPARGKGIYFGGDGVAHSVNIPVFIPPVEVVFLQVRGEIHFGIHRRGEVLPGFYEDFDFPRSPAGGAPHIAAVKVQGDHLEILFRELGGYFQNRAYAGIVSFRSQLAVIKPAARPLGGILAEGILSPAIRVIAFYISLIPDGIPLVVSRDNRALLRNSAAHRGRTQSVG